MDIVLLVARILFGALFIMSGIGHFKAKEAMTGYAQYKKVPAPGLSVLLSGIAFLLGGLSIVLGAFAAIGSLVIAVVLLVTAVLMHPFWKEEDATAKQNEQIAFNKDIALVGAALAFFYLFNQFGDQIGLVLFK